jgi:diadenosine tetraphosphate (Ap4A) HIT family hydrolase
MPQDSFVDMGHARFDDQKAVMEQILRDGKCPFCMENLFQYHKMPVLKDGKFWVLTYIQWPRENTRVHLLLIYKQHAVKLSEIDREAAQEFFEFVTWAEQEFGVRGGLFFMRFGETEYSGGSVYHLHAQYVVPDKENPQHDPVRFKTG